MKRREITAADADEFCAEMCRKFRARIIRKSNAIEMQMLGALFDVIRVVGVNVPSAHDFKRYATTIGPAIYLPDELSPQAMVELVTHELQHVVQFWRGGFGFMWLYLVEPEARVTLEAEACGAGLAVHHVLTGVMPALDALVFPLEQGYALEPTHLTLGRGLLEQQATSVSHGIYSTEAGEAAVAWLRARGIV